MISQIPFCKAAWDHGRCCPHTTPLWRRFSPYLMSNGCFPLNIVTYSWVYCVLNYCTVTLLIIVGLKVGLSWLQLWIEPLSNEDRTAAVATLVQISAHILFHPTSFSGVLFFLFWRRAAEWDEPRSDVAVWSRQRWNYPCHTDSFDLLHILLLYC